VVAGAGSGATLSSVVALAHQLRALEEAIEPAVDAVDLETALHHVVEVAADAYHALRQLEALEVLEGRALCDEAIHRFRSLRAKLTSAGLAARVVAMRTEEPPLLASHVEAMRDAASLLLTSGEQMALAVRRSLGYRLSPNGRAAMLAVIDERLARAGVDREVLETLRRRVVETMPPRAVQLGDLPDEVVDDLLRAATQQARFADLTEIWRTETAYLSSTTAIVRHPAYREIIEMGSAAVPLILRELARRPGHWGPALAQITGDRPLSPEDAGQPEAIAAAWLR
jgi:hypothetical protein